VRFKFGRIAGVAALHLLAKEVLLKERKVLLPELKLKSEKSIWMPGIDYETTLLVKPWQIVNIDSVELEVKIGNIIPDVIVRKKDRILFIEIKVTHGIDDKKLAYIKENNINVIEYDFSKSRNIIEEDHIKNVLTTSYKGAKKGFGRGEWVNHCKMKETIEQLNESYKEKVRKHKKSELPINKEPSIKSTTDDIENAQIKKSYDYKPYH
jgi:hypothetical protein